MRAVCLVSVVVVSAAASLFAAAPDAEWTGFRGPGGLAASGQTGLPVEWSAEKNIAWRTALPGAGSSCPIVVADRVYVTCYSGYAQSEDEPGEMDDLMRHVVCVDRGSGRILWRKDFKPELPEHRYQGNGARHGYASSTPASDGRRLYVFFGKSGLYCFDLDGNQLWHAELGSEWDRWGSASSPVLYKDLVIVNAAVESNRLVALNKRTGELAWEVGGIRRTWSTPLLVDLPGGGGTELVQSTPRRLLGIDPQTGRQLWECEGIPDGYVCPSPVAHDGVVYVIGGRRNTAIAVKAGGRGDVTDSHVLWTKNAGSNVASPVYHDGRLYWLHDGRGIAYCLDAGTGETVYQERLRQRRGRVYASGMLADGRLYYVSQHAGAFVVEAGPEFELLAHNVIEDDRSRVNASPVPSRGRLLLRSDRFLYCIGKK